jgi:hypothetical protein
MSLLYRSVKQFEYARRASGGAVDGHVVERGAVVVSITDSRPAPRGSVVLPSTLMMHLLGQGAIEPARAPLRLESSHSVGDYVVNVLVPDSDANVGALRTHELASERHQQAQAAAAAASERLEVAEAVHAELAKRAPKVVPVTAEQVAESAAELEQLRGVHEQALADLAAAGTSESQAVEPFAGDGEAA